MSTRPTADQINQQEPAFSRPQTMVNENLDYAVPGLTKLEYAAIHIAGSIASSCAISVNGELKCFDHADIASDAIRIARAVLAQTQTQSQSGV